MLVARARCGHSGAVTSLGRQGGGPLIVDLRDCAIGCWPVLWDALMQPCGLAEWFGRSLDAWWDRIQTGAVSATLDEHSALIVYVTGPWFSPSRTARRSSMLRTNATTRQRGWSTRNCRAVRLSFCPAVHAGGAGAARAICVRGARTHGR